MKITVYVKPTFCPICYMEMGNGYVENIKMEYCMIGVIKSAL